MSVSVLHSSLDSIRLVAIKRSNAAMRLDYGHLVLTIDADFHIRVNTEGGGCVLDARVVNGVTHIEVNAALIPPHNPALPLAIATPTNSDNQVGNAPVVLRIQFTDPPQDDEAASIQGFLETPILLKHLRITNTKTDGLEIWTQGGFAQKRIPLLRVTPAFHVLLDWGQLQPQQQPQPQIQQQFDAPPSEPETASVGKKRKRSPSLHDARPRTKAREASDSDSDSVVAVETRLQELLSVIDEERRYLKETDKPEVKDLEDLWNRIDAAAEAYKSGEKWDRKFLKRADRSKARIDAAKKKAQ
jgi:hypothetical protein